MVVVVGSGCPGYVDSFWLTALPPLSTAEALRLLVGVPLPERENSVRSWREGSLYMATEERKGGKEIRKRKKERERETERKKGKTESLHIRTKTK